MIPVSAVVIGGFFLEQDKISRGSELLSLVCLLPSLLLVSR